LFAGLSARADAKNTRTPASPSEYALTLASARLGLVFLSFFLFFVLVSGRLALLTLGHETAETQPLQAASGTGSITARSDITDRNGTVLATSLPTVMLMADARKILDAQDAAKKLKTVLPALDVAALTQEIQTSKRFITLQRHLTPRQYYEINKMGIAGLEFIPDESRIYPAGSITSHVLGYTDTDNDGIAGLEKNQNERLQTQDTPLVTTLDIRLQTILHRELSQAVETFHAIGAAGLIMDVSNGEILALVSLPDFNPQSAGAADDDTKFNRATLGVYEMGSTFKTFNTAMALDSGQIKAGERFNTTQPIVIGSKTIRDYHPAKHWMNVAEIFMESSNIGSARMANKIGTTQQRLFLGRLGLTEKTSLELPEVGAPIVPSSANWRDTATMTIAFGHGIAVNAVQLCSAAASLLNGGLLVKPTLIKGTNDALTKKEGTIRVVSEHTSAQMRALMRLVVKHGTAKKAEVAGYLVGGKTGTADKITGKHYSENARMSSFLGVFPASAPRYIVFALLDDPKGNAKTYGFATGGWTAAPVVGNVVSQIGPLLDMAPVDADVMAATERQLLRPLGSDVLESLNLGDEADDYAAVESNRAH
jgi:cell division protein FtsI (penicillin-binding protein 3)